MLLVVVVLWLRHAFIESELHTVSRTRALMIDIVVGIKSYQTEYDKWPVSNTPKDHFAVLRGSLVSCLLGEKSDSNPLEIKFVDLPPARDSQPGVMHDSTGEPQVLDQWGHLIYVGIVTNHDNSWAMPDGSKYTGREPPLGVALFSAGRDGIPGNTDDLTTWR